MNNSQEQESLSMETKMNIPHGMVIAKEDPSENSLEKRLDTTIFDMNNLEGFSPKMIALDDTEVEGTKPSVAWIDGKSDNECSFTQNTAELKIRSFSENDLIYSKNGRCVENLTEDPEWLLTSGKYSDEYAVIKQIGRGAYGSVAFSYRRNNGLIVVTKFIKKSQVNEDRWIEISDTGKKVCLEVDLLMRLNHPNIVKGLEYFENDIYFQLIMEKWGSGMDLFEFIERNPALDEPLVSYLFRQIVSPLLYLKSLNIIHRDIKDENIIINEQFHIKLIDFGSAAYLEDGKQFDQFAGTIEYCSPEVLDGKEYNGPELEIWSLGITLYTIVCGENPFNTVDEILESSIVISSDYSKDLVCLLSGMLHKNPKERMNLEEISVHKWTNQQVDLEMYSFEDVIVCSNEELSPPEHITEVEGFKEDYGTSNSFINDNRRTYRSKGTYLLQSPNFFRISKEEPEKVVKEADEVASHSSKNNSLQSSPSYESSAPIDFPVSFCSKNTSKNTTNRSSFTNITNATYIIALKSPGKMSCESKSDRFSPRDKRDDSTFISSVNDLSINSKCSDVSVVSNSTEDSTNSSSENYSTEDSTISSSENYKYPDEVFSISSSGSEIGVSPSRNNSFVSEGSISSDFGSYKLY